MAHFHLLFVMISSSIFKINNFHIFASFKKEKMTWDACVGGGGGGDIRREIERIIFSTTLRAMNGRAMFVVFFLKVFKNEQFDF